MYCVFNTECPLSEVPLYCVFNTECRLSEVPLYTNVYIELGTCTCSWLTFHNYAHVSNAKRVLDSGI